MEKKLLNTTEDVTLLVNEFYTKVKVDELLGPIFNNVENFSWDHHIPVMISFWESVLLGAGSYRGNAMGVHLELDRKQSLSAVLFERWLKLFYETLDDYFEGSQKEIAKKRASSMAGLIQYKIQESKKKGFIQ